MKKERNSSVEMLRILAMLGIVIMHTNGPAMERGLESVFVWTQIENGIFNAGVSILFYIRILWNKTKRSKVDRIGIDSDSLCGFKRISGMLFWKSVYIKHNQIIYSYFNELLLVYFLLYSINGFFTIYQ